jgi:hypothetical protein
MYCGAGRCAPRTDPALAWAFRKRSFRLAAPTERIFTRGYSTAERHRFVLRQIAGARTLPR